MHGGSVRSAFRREYTAVFVGRSRASAQAGVGAAVQGTQRPGAGPGGGITASPGGQHAGDGPGSDGSAARYRTLEEQTIEGKAYKNKHRKQKGFIVQTMKR